MNRIIRISAATVLVALSTFAFSAAETDQTAGEKIAALGWQRGPATKTVGTTSKIEIPADTAMLNETDSSRFLELTGNLPGPGTNVLAAESWWATFEFDPAGYVKDDERIDADELLKQLKASDEPSNEERRKRGLAELHTEGWYVPPHYDNVSKHLEWALRLRASDSPSPVINYTVRLLGRSGYERVTLVSTPEALDADVRSFKAVLRSFKFGPGEQYAEFRQGDRVAEVGLAALVVGGAAAVATKTGFWKVIVAFLAASWKLVAAACVAVLAGIGKLLGRGQRQ